MKQFIVALLAIMMIVGCAKTEDTAKSDETTPEMSSEEAASSSSADETEEDSTAGTSTEEDHSDSASVGESNEEHNQTSAADTHSKSANVLVGKWTGKIKFDESDRELFKGMGATDQDIDQMVAMMTSASSSLELKSDMTFSLSSPAPNGTTQTMDSTWSIVDDNKISLIFEVPSGPAGAGGPMPVEMIVSSDKKTLEMSDPTGMTKSKTVYTKN